MHFRQEHSGESEMGNRFSTFPDFFISSQCNWNEILTAALAVTYIEIDCSQLAQILSGSFILLSLKSVILWLPRANKNDVELISRSIFQAKKSLDVSSLLIFFRFILSAPTKAQYCDKEPLRFNCD